MEGKVNEKIISALDLGSSTIKFLIAEVTDGRPSIIGVGSVPSRSINKGIVTDLNKAAEAITAAKKQAETMAGKKATPVYVSISGNHVYSLNNKGIIVISKEGREITKEDIRRVEESAKVLLLQPNQDIIHVLPRQFIIDGQDGIRNPIGMSGIKLEEEVHIITGSTTSLHNIKKCIRMADLELNGFVLQSLASSYAIINEEEKELGVALLDIGAGTGDLAIFANGNIAHTSVLPIGGEYITKDIAYGLRIPLEEAESIKKNHGFVETENNNPTGEIEIDKFGSTEKRKVSLDFIGNIITSRSDEILEGIRLELMKSGYWNNIPAGIVITGGCSLLKNFVERASEIIEIPARIGYPDGNFAIAEFLHSPAYSTSVGLIKFAIENEIAKHKKMDFLKHLSWVKDIFG